MNVANTVLVNNVYMYINLYIFFDCLIVDDFVTNKYNGLILFIGSLIIMKINQHIINKINKWRSDSVLR